MAIAGLRNSRTKPAVASSLAVWKAAPFGLRCNFRFITAWSPIATVVAITSAISWSPPLPKLAVVLEWRGKSEDEIGIDSKGGEVLVEINPRCYRLT